MAYADRGKPDFTTAAGLRRRPIGAGSAMETLMQSPRTKLFLTVEELFGAIPAAIVGGVATRAYAPERTTQDLDVLVDHGQYSGAVLQIEARGWRKLHELVFPNTMLGLYGSAWS